jgi:hypothetical protein
MNLAAILGIQTTDGDETFSKGEAFAAAMWLATLFFGALSFLSAVVMFSIAGASWAVYPTGLFLCLSLVSFVVFLFSARTSL